MPGSGSNYMSFIPAPICSMEDGHVTRRVDSFISSPDAKTLTGGRRMGTGRLLDMLATHISEKDGSANIIRVKDVSGEEMICRIRSEIDTDNENHILLYNPVTVTELDSVVASFPDAHVYRAQELCHQVPACVRESL